jgi:hypothetical protein
MPNTMSKFTQKDLADYGIAKGYISKDGYLQGPMQVSKSLDDSMLSGLGQWANDAKYKDFVKRLESYGMVTSATTGKGGTGEILHKVSIDRDIANFDPYMQNLFNKKIADFTNTAMFVSKTGVGSSDIKNYNTSAYQISNSENRKKEADALAAEIKAEKEAVNLAILKAENKRKEDMQQTIRQEETKQQKKDEYRDTGQTTYRTKDTGGYVTTPNQPSAPPGERGGGGFTGVPKKGKGPSRSNQRIKRGPNLSNR